MNPEKNIFFLILALLFTGPLFAQRIDRVNFITKGNNIEVTYSVIGLKFNQTLNTSLFVSIDGGKSFNGPLKFISGEIGSGITNGQHLVIWESTKEIPLDDADMIFDVRAEIVETKINQSFFVALSGNMVTPLGVRVGVLGKTGYYVSLQSNSTPGLSGSYTYKDGVITDYDKFAWYQFTSEHEVATFSACAGITLQAGRNFFLYGGAGYGKEAHFYKIDEFSYESDSPLGSDYGKDVGASVTGLAIEAGIVLKIKKLVLLGGATTTGFRTMNLVAGIGYSF